MITIHNLAAETLLKNPDVIHSGYLKYQVSYSFLKLWKKYFVILLNETFYFYNNPKSEFPTRLEGLQGVNRVDINTDINDPFKCIFVINFKDLTIRPIKFAAPSIEQMELWVNKLNDNILDKSEYYEEINEAPNNYYGEPSEQQSISTTSRKYLPEEIILENIENTENTENETENESNFTLPISSSTNKIDKENIYFYGNKQEAFKMLSIINQIGSYLIRKDGERLILTVQCTDLIVKFILRTDEINHKISIEGEKESFFDIQSLLEYYSLNNIPRQHCKLSNQINTEIFEKSAA